MSTAVELGVCERGGEVGAGGGTRSLAAPAGLLLLSPSSQHLRVTFLKTYKQTQKKENYLTCNAKTLDTKGSVFPRPSQNIRMESLFFIARPTSCSLFILLNSLRQSGC